MDEGEWARWQEPLFDKDRIGSPCAFCPWEWHVEMRAVGRCDGQPLAQNGRPRLESSARMERRRAQWRAYRARKRAEIVAVSAESCAGSAA